MLSSAGSTPNIHRQPVRFGPDFEAMLATTRSRTFWTAFLANHAGACASFDKVCEKVVSRDAIGPHPDKVPPAWQPICAEV